MARHNTKESYKEDVHDLFMLWLLTPKADRVPKTQVAFAKSHGVDPTTLSRWKRDPKFVKSIFKQTPFLVAYEWSEIIRGVIMAAKDGNISSAIFLSELLSLKTVINYAGEHNEDDSAEKVKYKDALDRMYGYDPDLES